MDTFKRILHYSKPYWWRIVISMAASLCVGGTDAAIAWMVEPLLKKIFSERDMTIFILVPVALIIVFLFRGVARFLQGYYVQTAGQLAIQDIRNEVYRKQIGLPLRYFTDNPTGTLMSRIMSDVGQMQQGVANIVTSLLRDGVTAIGLLGVIFYRNWQLALITFIVLPLTAVPAQKIGKRIKNLAKQSLGQMGEITSILQETFSGIKVVKAFRQEKSVVDRFSRTNLGLYRYLRKSIKYESLHTPIMEIITSFGVAGVIWFGGSQVMDGKMTAPEFFSFLTAMVMLYGPIKKVLSAYNTVQQAMGAAERVFEVIDHPADIQDPPDPVEPGMVRGSVELRNVSFRYDDEEVLRDVSFTAGRGEVVALVGPSGAGKTTVMSLIPRFYDVTGGAVLIDGIDVRRLRLDDLLCQIALVDQETILFNETIANNIRLGNPDATLEEVERAARSAFAHDFIMEMPEGYDTNIGDRGVRLSGGQRQRLCIARAILKNAPILLLDEATSALDTESEHMVQQALTNLMKNRTTLVIAHRLSTVLHADRIVVIDKGEVVEVGTNDELLARDGLYRKLYDMQFK
ncbi:lipid A export permease/ATP-binding protein MsbA [Geobacter sulfurreducens]|jgi:subfamily B ATP-binding cassette protein MsbA|uniref:Phospholipid/lipopolysaccharide-flipping ABC transporter MsbA n=1 Tax=Geobacter sulfurreducens (strain ATCC 51573 / DSM 12127 / PCA) TaxID=243231 RepID=Q74AU0_GEOSL|nr:lipid A export permease/ATP-binding protein MsbA [Geobacter sulfurreducens]AAR35636.1 phospholipid/lipopolysaccharide-flipping ABC transporter MsbA [Geobacter sulfurreducens PCA]ADI85018.1 phospholipid/lipopolysaccharide-flipping ABC transporter MsbA [Geobacter sulfurreducens KN400]QVW34113.1 lipid A export permease/ATP-binding protein MsbA [Geobacter sulfurreducens]UAC02974.1 lipid A export permease/ATP-binding protein MsbA [Geobacter sulfurreducens]UTG91621.1 lipid A export permease/ATP-b